MSLSALKRGALFVGMLLLAPVVLAQSKISIVPASATVLNNGTVQFTPDTKGENLGPFEWQVNGKHHGDNTIGWITDNGVYAAPAYGTGTTAVTVTVISTSHPNLRDSAKVVIGRQSITLSPIAATIETNSTMILSVTWFPGLDLGTSPRWQVNSVDAGNAGFGTITKISDHEARYTAPKDTTVASTVTVSFLSTDEKFSGSANIVIVSDSCPSQKCLEILLDKQLKPLNEHALVLASSLPAEPSEEIHFAVRGPGSDPVPVNWNWSGDPNNAGTAPQFSQTTDTKATFVAPSEPPFTPITITAIPKVAGYTATSIKVYVMKRVWARCFSVKVITPHSNDSPSDCLITDFDRLKGETGQYPARTVAADNSLIPAKAVGSLTDAGVVTAINASKTVFSGSVLSVKLADGASALNCVNYDWKLIVQSEESAGILIYDPSDVGSGVCEGDRFLVALPVHVLWAYVYGYHQTLDPARAAPAKPSSYTDCLGQSAKQTITPCDRDTSGAINTLYNPFFGWVLNHFSPPGSGKGTITFNGKGQVTYDIQADPAYKIGIGWFNVPVLFERGPAGANLNSLMFAEAYDFRWLRKPNFGDPSPTSRIIFRKPQLQIRSGLELSPSRPGTASTTENSRDWNYVFGESVRFPVVFNFHDQPSSFSFYPVFGGEQGWHMTTNLPLTNPIFRGVAGADASFRWPFNLTHNILGSTPITVEGQYRVRWLAYAEPFADFANLPPTGTSPPCPNRVGIGVLTSSTGQQSCVALNELSSKAQSYLKGNINFPIDPYIQVTVSVTKGSLPPAFWLIGWTYSLGLSFNNPASSEH